MDKAISWCKKNGLIWGFLAALLSISQRLHGASVAMAGSVSLSELSAFTGWASLSLNIIS